MQGFLCLSFAIYPYQQIFSMESTAHVHYFYADTGKYK